MCVERWLGNGLFQKLVIEVEQCHETKFAYRALSIIQIRPGRFPQRRKMFCGPSAEPQPGQPCF